VFSSGFSGGDDEVFHRERRKLGWWFSKRWRRRALDVPGFLTADELRLRRTVCGKPAALVTVGGRAFAPANSDLQV